MTTTTEPTRGTATFPTAAERARDRDWTAKRPRPKAGDFPPGLLEANQRIWDADEAKRQEREALARPIRERRAAEAASKREAEAARRAELVAAEDAKLVAELRRRYLGSDPTATEAQFQADLPELRRQHRLNAALGGASADEAARAANARRYF